jgi:hypothetical protein
LFFSSSSSHFDPDPTILRTPLWTRDSKTLFEYTLLNGIMSDVSPILPSRLFSWPQAGAITTYLFPPSFFLLPPETSRLAQSHFPPTLTYSNTRTIQQQPPQQQTSFGQVTGGGLGSSEIVKNLPKSTGGEGMTREELDARRAAEAQAKNEAKSGGEEKK